MTLTVADMTLSSSSFKHSRSRGHDERSSSGDCKKHLYRTITAFFRTCGEVCESFVTKSGARSRAKEGEAICASPLIANVVSGEEEEKRS